MLRSWRGVLIFVFVAALAAACAGSGAETEEAPAAGAGAGTEAVATDPADQAASSDEVIKLFYAAPLTGGAADQGIAGCQGAELAVENLNAEGGIEEGSFAGASMAVECLDTELSTDVVATIANRYIAEDDVWTLFGFYSSGEGQAAGQVAQRAGLSVIGSNIGADFLTDEADNIVVMLPKLRSIAYGSVLFANEYFGATKFADLSPDFSFMDSFRAGRDEALETLPEASLVAEETYPGFDTQDFGPYLTRVNSSGAEVILVGSYPPEQCQIAAQARSRGVKQPIMDWTTTGTGTSCIEAGGEAYTGLIFSEAIPPAEPGSLLDEVGQQFAEEHGTRMTAYSAYAYDSVLAVKYAIEAGAQNREELLGYLADLDAEGLTGPIAFNEDLRPTDRTGSFFEATGDTVDDLDLVGTVRFDEDGTASLIDTEQCGDRPTCQLNR